VATIASPTIIVHGTQGFGAVVLLLLPYLTTVCEQPLFERLKQTSAINIDIARHYFHPSDVPEETFRAFVQGLVRQAGDATEQVVRAYAIFAKSVSGFALCVYSVCGVLLRIGVRSGAFGAIAKTAQLDKSPRNSAAACGFLQACLRAGVETGMAPLVQRFPVVELPVSFKVDQWQPSNQMNECDRDAPPFYPTDPTLTLLPYAKAIKEASLQVRITPFTEWSDVMFTAEGTLAMAEFVALPAKIGADRFKSFKAMMRTVDKEIKSTRLARVGTDFGSSLRMSVQRPPGEDPVASMAEEFAPDQAEIDGAGQEIDGAEFPSVFPI
jgi:hypothetical protein